jgi:hypothetical protein
MLLQQLEVQCTWLQQLPHWQTTTNYAQPPSTNGTAPRTPNATSLNAFVLCKLTGAVLAWPAAVQTSTMLHSTTAAADAVADKKTNV